MKQEQDLTLGRILDLAKAIAFPLDVTSILHNVADAVLQQCGADEVSIMLPTRDNGQELYVAVARGAHAEQFLGTRVSMEEGIAGWVALVEGSISIDSTPGEGTEIKAIFPLRRQ